MFGRSDIVRLLAKKRAGQELTETEMNDFVMMAAEKTIGDSQIGAMLMAIAIRGLTDVETANLTRSMTNSGYVFKWDDKEVICDKHSTGGVGDKISIPLAPALASLGVKVPMFSGRGLGITGGTLDKLESIPGFKVNYRPDELKDIIKKCGVFIAETNKDICPGDNALYSIRDVTATVDSDELIVGSILSKKAAAGVKHLVLDVKVGKAAIYKSEDVAVSFVKKMKTNAAHLNINLDVVLTRMDDPIGNYVGNSLEIEESILVLQGKGSEDVKELVKILGGQVIALSGLAPSPDAGALMIQEALENGSALTKFEEMILSQGVNPEVARKLCHEDSRKVLGAAQHETDIYTKESGWVKSIDAEAIAAVVRDLGGGRKLKSQPIDHRAGVVVQIERGSFVSKGFTWLKVFHNEKLSEKMKRSLEDALSLSNIQPPPVTSRKISVI